MPEPAEGGRVSTSSLAVTTENVDGQTDYGKFANLKPDQTKKLSRDFDPACHPSV